MTNIVESRKQVNRDMISPAIGEFAAADRERLIEELQAARDRAELAEREAATNADTIAAQQLAYHHIVAQYERDFASIRKLTAETIDRSVALGVAGGAVRVSHRILQRLDSLVRTTATQERHDLRLLLKQVISIISDEVEAMQEKRS